MDGRLKMSARDKQAQAHAPDAAAVKAITTIQTCLWENSVGFCWSDK